jgi:hypothetical protein
MPPEPLHGRCCGRAGSLTKMCWGQARNWHTMPTSTTYDSRVGRLFNGFIAHRARSYTQSVCLSAGVRVPRGPSTSTARTTISDGEIITADGPYAAAFGGPDT